MNVDRYLTDEVVWAAARAAHETKSLRESLAAALPGILAQHRTDVLREAAQRTAREGQRFDRDGKPMNAKAADNCAAWLLRLADEAVAA